MRSVMLAEPQAVPQLTIFLDVLACTGKSVEIYGSLLVPCPAVGFIVGVPLLWGGGHRQIREVKSCR